MSTAPVDFAVRYVWAEGTVPPPHHYEYEIHLGPGPHGRIEFHPDYGNAPAWVETFEFPQAAADSLYLLLKRIDAFEREWKPEHHAPVGGSLERFTATADSQSVTLPFYLCDAAARRAAAEVFGRIQQAVPQSVWDRLRRRHAEYIESYDGP